MPNRYDASKVLTEARNAIFEAFETHGRTIQLREEQVNGYDFNLGAVSSTSRVISVKAMITKSGKKKAKVTPDHDYKVYVKSEQVEPSLYSSASWGSEVFSIVDFDSNGYITCFYMKGET